MAFSSPLLLSSSSSPRCRTPRHNHVACSVCALLCTLLSLQCALAFHVPAAQLLWREKGTPAVMSRRGGLERGRCFELRANSGNSGDNDSAKSEEDKMERVKLETENEEPSALGQEIVDLGRRTLVATLGVALVTGYVNIYGDTELNEFDSFLRKTFPDRYKKQRIRPQLNPTFAAGLADVYESVAVNELRLLSSESLRDQESRKDFGKRVGAKILTSGLVSDSFKLQDFQVRDPLADFDVWLAGSKGLINAYTLGGFGVLTVGEKGIGELRAEEWLEDKRASFSLFVGDLALTDAAQALSMLRNQMWKNCILCQLGMALAGEALDDMAAALLPSLPLIAFLERCGIQADAESYYMSSQYTRNPADYRPDGVAIQFNLEYAPTP